MLLHHVLLVHIANVWKTFLPVASLACSQPTKVEMTSRLGCIWIVDARGFTALVVIRRFSNVDLPIWELFRTHLSWNVSLRKCLETYSLNNKLSIREQWEVKKVGSSHTEATWLSNKYHIRKVIGGNDITWLSNNYQKSYRRKWYYVLLQCWRVRTHKFVLFWESTTQPQYGWWTNWILSSLHISTLFVIQISFLSFHRKLVYLRGKCETSCNRRHF